MWWLLSLILNSATCKWSVFQHEPCGIFPRVSFKDKWPFTLRASKRLINGYIGGKSLFLENRSLTSLNCFCSSNTDDVPQRSLIDGALKASRWVYSGESNQSQSWQFRVKGHTHRKPLKSDLSRNACLPDASLQRESESEKVTLTFYQWINRRWCSTFAPGIPGIPSRPSTPGKPWWWELQRSMSSLRKRNVFEH